MPLLLSGVAVPVVAADVVLAFTMEVSVLDVLAVVDNAVLTVEDCDKMVLTLMVEVDNEVELTVEATVVEVEEMSCLAPYTPLDTRAPTDDFK